MQYFIWIYEDAPEFPVGQNCSSVKWNLITPTYLRDSPRWEYMSPKGMFTALMFSPNDPWVRICSPVPGEVNSVHDCNIKLVRERSFCPFLSTKLFTRFVKRLVIVHILLWYHNNINLNAHLISSVFPDCHGELLLFIWSNFLCLFCKIARLVNVLVPTFACAEYHNSRNDAYVELWISAIFLLWLKDRLK